MKLGLVVAFYLLSHVVVSEYFLFSVFIIGIDVGQMNGNTLSGGKVAFRIIMFNHKNKDALDKPKVNHLVWSVSYMNDFELTFAQLGKKFQDSKFTDLNFNFSFDIDAVKNYKDDKQVIKDTSLKLILDFGVFETKNTHVVSYMTDNSNMKSNKYAITCDTGCTITFVPETRGIPSDLNSTLNFQILENFSPNAKCKQPNYPISFVMESIKLDQTNGGGSGSWKNANYKVRSFVKAQEIVWEELTPFKMKAASRLAVAIIILNDIPLALLNASGSGASQCKLPYTVNYSSSDSNKGLEPFNDSESGWPAMKHRYITGTNILKSDYSNNNLNSKWQGDAELISKTFSVKCLARII